MNSNTNSTAPRESARQNTANFSVGQSGPGGGTVFFVAEKPFACGQVLYDLCTHLEVSPFAAELELTWAATTNQSLMVPGADASTIGYGYRNTLEIVAQTRNEIGNSAAVYASAYTNNGYDDWYLPSLDELSELCKYANHQPTGDTNVSCDGNGNLREDFSGDDYWSSTQADATSALLIDIPLGGAGRIGKASIYRVRPIRAF